MTLPETITLWLLDHRDGTGARITGETWDTSTCRDPAGDPFTPTITEPYSDGIYRATWSADTAGDWLFDVQGQTDPASDDYHWSAVVAVTDEPSFPTVDDITTAVATRLRRQTVTVAAPVRADRTVEIVQGDDYLAADGRALEWTSTGWPDLTGATVEWQVSLRGTETVYPASVVDADTVRVELTAEQTAALTPRQLRTYQLVATMPGGSIVTLTRGELFVEPD